MLKEEPSGAGGVDTAFNGAAAGRSGANAGSGCVGGVGDESGAVGVAGSGGGEGGHRVGLVNDDACKRRVLARVER